MGALDANIEQVVSGTKQYDPWVDEASKDIYTQAQEATGEYVPYTGDRVADLTANLKQASGEAATEPRFLSCGSRHNVGRSRSF